MPTWCWSRTPRERSPPPSTTCCSAPVWPASCSSAPWPTSPSASHCAPSKPSAASPLPSPIHANASRPRDRPRDHRARRHHQRHPQRLDHAAAQQRRFVADAAHELRSPLTTLLTSLEVALAYPERTDWPATATTAARQTRRLQALAEDLLLLARLDTGAPRPTRRPST
ncbi:histidine kinase dimerization/phospho-acceptor domain-containing protein [Streptomyces thermocarboxydus]